jgi:hypothetical protein
MKPGDRVHKLEIVIQESGQTVIEHPDGITAISVGMPSQEQQHELKKFFALAINHWLNSPAGRAWLERRRRDAGEQGFAE